jgi:tetratricopeptide (TPR) repeat protein
VALRSSDRAALSPLVARPQRIVKSLAADREPSVALRLWGASLEFLGFSGELEPFMTLRPAASCRHRLWRARVLSALAVLALSACTDLPEPAAGFSPTASYAAESLHWGGAPAEPGPSGDSLAASYLAGRIALDDGNLRLAAENFGNALARDPENFEIRRQAFVLNLSIGEYETTLDLAETLVPLDPGFGEARLLLASRAVLAGDFTAATTQLEGIGERELVALARPIFAAWIDFGAGDAQGAIDTLNDTSAAGGLERIQRYHAALMLVLADRLPEAVLQMRPLVDPETGNPVRLVTALAEIEAGGTPELPAADPATGMADALLSLATALDEQNASAQALVFARLAGYLAPGQADVALLIAQINLRQGNAAEAVDVLRAVSPDATHAWEARLLGAQALAALEREDEAVAELEAMAGERPERIDALVTQGDIRRRQERYREAEAAYDRAIQRLPEITLGHWPLLYSRGITRERTNRWPEAEADFLAALELQPEQPLVLNYLGYSWVDQGLNLAEAETMLRRAVDLRPDDGYIVDSMGWAYYRLERFDEAVTYLERAVELRPDDPVINDHLGDAYWQVGRHREARFQWQRALTFEPEDDQIVLIEEKLRRGLQAAEQVPDRG